MTVRRHMRGGGGGGRVIGRGVQNCFWGGVFDMLSHPLSFPPPLPLSEYL